MIHGGHEAVNFACDAPDVKAVSFVGGNQVCCRACFPYDMPTILSQPTRDGSSQPERAVADAAS